jgi:tRNA(Arg) A34 adenosine deaminase TadA
MSSAPKPALPALDHAFFLRQAFAVARQARANGNHPFGAVLVGPDGQVRLTGENGYWPDRDMTAHAERLLATLASRTLDPGTLARCSLYSSAEPCAMCAYGLSERRLRSLTGDHPENPTLDLPCRAVFAAGQRTIEVIGPLLEEEAAELHLGAWSAGAA